MAQFHDCVASARAQNAISDAEARDLIQTFDEQMGATGDAAKARDATVAAMEAEARRKENNALRQADILAGLAGYVEGYRRPTLTGRMVKDPYDAARAVLENKNNRMAGVPGVVGRRDGINSWWMGRLSEHLQRHERRFFSIAGARRGGDTIEDVAREAFGHDTGNPAAKAFLAAWRDTADEMVDLFNEAGGAVAKRKDYFPQSHSAAKMAEAGEDQWVADITRGLDRSRMTDPLTGGPLSAARLEESLRAIYPRILTDGAIDGPAHGHAALANQRQEHRFLVFKDAESWLEYSAAYGHGDPFRAMTDHLSGLAKDVAALQELGPNPNLTIEWLKQVVVQETKVNRDLGIDALWAMVNGGAGARNRAVADGMSALRNFVTATSLGATTLTAAPTDPFVQMTARFISGLPVFSYFRDMTNQLFSGASKADVLAGGLIFQDMLQHADRSMRNHTALSGANVVTGAAADRVLTWSGLNVWTDSGSRAMAQAFMVEASRHAARSLDDIAKVDPRFARRLRGQGVRPEDWDIIRSARPQDLEGAGGMITMMEVVNSAPGDRRVFEAAVRYSAAVNAVAEEGVPRGTAHAQDLMGRAANPGSPAGELSRTGGQFLTYAVTVMSSQLRAIAWELTDFGRLRGGAYVAGAFAAYTMGGILAEQIREIWLNGRDARPLDTSLVLKGVMRGGGLGAFGDYILGDFSRGSSQVAGRGIGPVPSLAIEGLATLAIGNRLEGDEVPGARRAVDLAKRMVPFQNMWMVRPAMERMVWDRLHLLADPTAYRNWRRKERELMRDYEQGVWWGRGESEPRRVPDLLGGW